MSRKNTIKAFQVITDQSMSSNVTSKVTDIQSVDNPCYQVVCTGTPTGEFVVEGSINGVNWEALDIGNPGPEVVGSPISFLIDLNQVPYPQIRLRYIASSGTGTMNAWIAAKSIGA